MVRAGLLKAIDRHGAAVNADAGDAKTVAKHGALHHLCLERIPRDSLLEILRFNDIRERADVAACNHALAAMIPATQDPRWSHELRLGEDDEEWFMLAMARGSPLLPDLDRLQHLDVAMRVAGESDDVPWILRHSAGVRKSVTDLTLRYRPGEYPPNWPDWPETLADWPRLTALRLLTNEPDRHFRPQWIRREIVGSLLLRNDAPPMRVLRVHTTTHSYGQFEELLRVVHGRLGPGGEVGQNHAAHLFAGLEDLGLRVQKLGTSTRWWRLLTSACPKLRKLVLHSEHASNLRDAMWGVVGPAWPEMRHFSVHAGYNPRPHLTTAGLAPIGEHWKHLEVLRVRVGWWADDDVHPMHRTPAPTADTVPALAKCIAQWPALRHFHMYPLGNLVVQEELLDALDRCPRLQKFEIITMDTEFATTELQWTPIKISEARVRAFFERHRELRDLSSFSILPMATHDKHEEVLAIGACPEVREWYMRVIVGRPIDEKTTIEGVRYWRSLRSLNLDGPASISRGGLLSALRLPSKTAATGTLVRPLREIKLRAPSGKVRIDERDLAAVIDSCPHLKIFEIRIPDDYLLLKSEADADSVTAGDYDETRVSVGAIIEMLHRCPDLETLRLAIAPLDGVDDLTRDLRILDDMHRATKCYVHFRLGEFRRDASRDALRWLAQRTKPLRGKPSVRRYGQFIRPKGEEVHAGDSDGEEEDDEESNE